MGVSVLGMEIEKQTKSEKMLSHLDKCVSISDMDKLESCLDMYLREFDVLVVVARFEIIDKYLCTLLSKKFNEPLVNNKEINNYFKQLQLYTYDLKLPENCRLFTRDLHQYPILCLHRLFILPYEATTAGRDLYDFWQYIQRFSGLQVSKHYTLLHEKQVDEFLEQEKYCGVCMKLDTVNNHLCLKISGKQTDIKNSPLKLVIQFQRKLYAVLGGCILKSEFMLYENQLFQSGNQKLVEAINHIGHCLATYGPKNVFLSFNGGKDCTVLLHMMLAVLKRNYPEFTDPVLCMYVKYKNPFPEIDDFIQDIKEYYNLEIVTITSDIKQALHKVLSERPNLKACLMGTRRMDPFSENLNHFQMTDVSWPQIMRVSPLLDWEYAQIWDYIMDFKVPYCSLYDDGYTSLGNVDNTVPNPELLYYDEDNKCNVYLPASKLYDSTKERLGRL